MSATTEGMAALPDTGPPTGSFEGPMRTARRAGLIEQVIDQLREQIVTGRWMVGARIPTEAELAQITATSRNTVREAVQSLVHSGLLERRQGSGTYVLAASELAGAVSRHMAAARRVDVLEVRRTLEAGAARLAAQRRTDEDATALQELLAGRTAARNGGDVDRLVAVDVALHRAIVRAARNPVLIELYDTLVLALAANVRHNVESRPLEQDDDHSRLIQAILDGDGERAADEAGRYLDGLISGC